MQKTLFRLLAISIIMLSSTLRADENLTDADSNLEAKRVAVLSAKLALGSGLLSSAAMEAGRYKLALHSAMVSIFAKDATVVSVILASEGLKLTEEAKAKISERFERIKVRFENAKEYWENMEESERSSLYDVFETVQQNLESLRSAVEETTVTVPQEKEMKSGEKETKQEVEQQIEDTEQEPEEV